MSLQAGYVLRDEVAPRLEEDQMSFAGLHVNACLFSFTQRSSMTWWLRVSKNVQHGQKETGLG
jgi:hypothetical protein